MLHYSKRILFAICVFGVAGVVVGVYAHFSARGGQPDKRQAGSYNSAEYVTDLSDDRKLVGISHNVFVGKVLEQTRYDGHTAMTQIWYTVGVIYNIKGNLKGTVTVNLFPGGAGLQVGSTYVLAAEYTKQEDEYTLSAEAYDRKLISDDPTLSDADLKAVSQKDARVQALQAAYPNEIVYPDWVKIGLTYNSYVSRHYDAQGNLIDDTVVLHEQFLAAHPSTAPGVSPTDSAPAAQAPANAPSDMTSPTATPDGSASTSPAPGTESVSPTPTPDQVNAPTDTPTPTPAPSDSTVPAAS